MLKMPRHMETIARLCCGAETIEAKYLVACDGAKSIVRHSLGLNFAGSTFERMFYVADVQLMNAKCARYFIRPGNPLTVQPDIRAKIYALELKPYLMSAINWRKTKLSSIPPGVAKRTILRHRKV